MGIFKKFANIFQAKALQVSARQSDLSNNVASASINRDLDIDNILAEFSNK